MNIAPLIRQLPTEDYLRVWASLRTREDQFSFTMAMIDPQWEIHIPLPREMDGQGAIRPGEDVTP